MENQSVSRGPSWLIQVPGRDGHDQTSWQMSLSHRIGLKIDGALKPVRSRGLTQGRCANFYRLSITAWSKLNFSMFGNDTADEIARSP